ncbi:MAG: ATP-binding cassette domain-containing protein [Propioniciclava sp.]|uniref:amino acid ABC transporter ATP-binding/permease protein n=1 Tax=Propioniciclava sp. TaxID=2038686 RepID=UPI0039E62F6E
MTSPLALLRRLVSSTPRGWARLVLAVALAFGASGASVALMGVSGWLLSRAAEHPPVMYLTAAAVGVRAFGIGRGAFRYLERLVGHDIGLRVQSALRLETYDKLARTTLLGRRRGDLLTRVVADVEAVLDLVVRVLLPFASGLFVLLVATLILGAFSWPAALAILGTALVAGVLAPWLASRLSARQDAAAIPLRGALADITHEISRTAPDLVAYGADAAALGRLASADAALREADDRAAWTRGLATALQVVAAGVAVLAGLILGADAVRAGVLERPMLAVLALTPLALHEVFADFTKSAQTCTRARAALARVAEVLTAEPVGTGDRDEPFAPTAGANDSGPDAGSVSPRIGAAGSPPGPPAPHESRFVGSDRLGRTGGGPVREGSGPAPGPRLTVRDLTLGWPGATPLLSGLSFSIGAGERVAVVGPSGVGKTTLAATVLGLIPPVAGRVEASRRIGYLAQDAHVFTTTLAENVKIGNKHATDDEVVAALARVRLNEDPARLVGELGATLSGGEQRRLALARLVVGDYGILVLDEPSEHLDPETATALLDDVWASSTEHAVLVITHDPDVIARCDRVITLG